jgi:hypothetical protein
MICSEVAQLILTCSCNLCSWYPRICASLALMVSISQYEQVFFYFSIFVLIQKFFLIFNFLLHFQIGLICGHQIRLVLLIKQIEVHEVWNAIHHIFVVYQNASHSDFYFRNCVGNQHKYCVEFHNYNFHFLKNRIVFVELHFNIFDFINIWLLVCHLIGFFIFFCLSVTELADFLHVVCVFIDVILIKYIHEKVRFCY